jgi:hypothetical protein
MLYLVWHFLVPIGAPMVLQAAGETGLSPLLDDAKRGELLQLAKGTVEGQPVIAGSPINGVIGAAVALYGIDGPRAAAACFNDEARAAIGCAAGKLQGAIGDFGALPTDRVSVHLLRELRDAKPVDWRDMGWGYSRGLYAVVYVGEKGARLFTDVQMHINGATIQHALKALRSGKGVPAAGTPPDHSSYIAPTESFTEYDGKPVALYRASTLIDIKDLTSDQIVAGCKLGGDYLSKIFQSETNQWLYEGDVGHDEYKSTYNLLRHAGTVYSLYQLAEATGEPRYRETADKGWQWLLEQIERESDKQGQRFAFPVERTIKKHDGEKRISYTVKLGGTGLTLVALSERLKVEPNESDLALGRALANHILRSQRPDGSFQSYWSYKGSKAKEKRSIYYPGEAMLGLMRFYQHDPDPRYLGAMERGADYAIEERWKIFGAQIYVPLDAWLAVALNEVHKLRPKAEYADYCLKLADMMENDQINASWETYYPDYYGGYFPYPPQATPAGSRLEGLTSCYFAAQRAGRDVRELKEVIRRSARFQVERILRPEFAHLYPNPRRALGAFRDTPVSNKIRIDNNQHNITSLLDAAKILADQQPAPR